MRGCAADTSVRHVDYARLRPLSYPQTDYVIIMYSVADRTSFEHAIGMWSDEIEKHLPNVGRLYLGLKTDLRDKLSDSVPAKSAMVNLTELAHLQHQRYECTIESPESMTEALRQALEYHWPARVYGANRYAKKKCLIS